VIVPKEARPSKRKPEIDVSGLVLLPHTKRACTLKTANIFPPPKLVTGSPKLASGPPKQSKRKRGERGPGKKIKDVKDTEITKKTMALNKEVSSNHHYLLTRLLNLQIRKKRMLN
jgi:hypothetical protein